MFGLCDSKCVQPLTVHLEMESFVCRRLILAFIAISTCFRKTEQSSYTSCLNDVHSNSFSPPRKTKTYLKFRLSYKLITLKQFLVTRISFRDSKEWVSRSSDIIGDMWINLKSCHIVSESFFWCICSVYKRWKF